MSMTDSAADRGDGCAMFESWVASAWPTDVWRDVHVVVAVSGGSDSVALLRGLDTLRRAGSGRGELIVAHYDHRVRAAASAADAEWVGALAERLGLACEFGASSTDGARSEQRLRDERRSFLLDVARRRGARYLATGHTADDQAETILFRLFRGSGVAGMRGIASASPLGDAVTLARPLLSVTRSEAIAYLRALGQPFRTDGTNASVEPTRNWIRHELLPQLEERFGPGVRDAVRRLGRQATEAHGAVERLAEALLERAQLVGGDSVLEFALADLAAADSASVVEAVRIAWRKAGWPERDMAEAHWRSIVAVARGDATAAQLPGDREARVVADRLVLRSC